MARGSRLARVAALGLLGVLVLSGCDLNNEFWRFGFPEGVTEESVPVRQLWTGSVIAALIVGFIVWGLIIWSVVFHRKKGDELPRQTAYNLPLEIAYSIFPFLIIAGLFFFTVVVQNDVQERSDDPDTTIAVNAFKWNWQFVYPETTGDDGEPVNTVGSTDEIPILVMPVDQDVRFEVASADVIHSFWVPEFLFKLDVIPGNENGRDNVFEVTVREEGAYVGRCAELCGSYHAFMQFELVVVSPERFDQFLQAKQGGASTADAMGAIGFSGDERYATTTRPLDTRRQQQSWYQSQGAGK